MRIATAAAIASICATTLVSAQMKKPANTPPPPVGALTRVPQSPIDTARRISRTDAAKLVKEGKAVYVDVRSKEQYDLGHIKGALSIPGSQLIARMREIEPQKLIITYCA